MERYKRLARVLGLLCEGAFFYAIGIPLLCLAFTGIVFPGNFIVRFHFVWFWGVTGLTAVFLGRASFAEWERPEE